MKTSVLRLLFLLGTALEISSEYPWKVIPMTGNNVTEKSPIKNGTLPRTVDMWSHHQNDSSISKKLNSVEKRSQSDIEEQIMKDAMSKPEYPKNNPKIPESSSSEPQAKKMNSADQSSVSKLEEQILKDAMSKPEYPKNNPKIPESSSSKSDGPDHEPDRSNDSSSASSVTKSVDSGRYKLLLYIQLCMSNLKPKIVTGY